MLKTAVLWTVALAMLVSLLALVTLEGESGLHREGLVTSAVETELPLPAMAPGLRP